ncbi:hypothetical protein BDN70DRAFT_900850 [Pholiota conissans]|uniref:Uncharacterized protein n=1 Tax=Pholiota conissans TaxID=109636 RepID=A0A9P6CM97_9AGAR|nr:hypothetical protein BDN70DRAFT_900850 [Pholiota conissans]
MSSSVIVTITKENANEVIEHFDNDMRKAIKDKTVLKLMKKNVTALVDLHQKRALPEWACLPSFKEWRFLWTSVSMLNSAIYKRQKLSDEFAAQLTAALEEFEREEQEREAVMVMAVKPKTSTKAKPEAPSKVSDVAQKPMHPPTHSVPAKISAPEKTGINKPKKAAGKVDVGIDQKKSAPTTTITNADHFKHPKSAEEKKPAQRPPKSAKTDIVQRANLANDKMLVDHPQYHGQARIIQPATVAHPAHTTRPPAPAVPTEEMERLSISLRDDPPRNAEPPRATINEEKNLKQPAPAKPKRKRDNTTATHSGSEEAELKPQRRRTANTSGQVFEFACDRCYNAVRPCLKTVRINSPVCVTCYVSKVKCCIERDKTQDKSFEQRMVDKQEKFAWQQKRKENGEDELATDEEAAIELGDNLSKPESKFPPEKDADQPPPAKKQKKAPVNNIDDKTSAATQSMKKVPINNIGDKSSALAQSTKGTAKGQVVEVLLPLRTETAPTKKVGKPLKPSMPEMSAHQPKAKPRPKPRTSAAPPSKKDLSRPADKDYDGDSEKAAKEPVKAKKHVQIKSKETVESDNDAGAPNPSTHPQHRSKPSAPMLKTASLPSAPAPKTAPPSAPALEIAPPSAPVPKAAPFKFVLTTTAADSNDSSTHEFNTLEEGILELLAQNHKLRTKIERMERIHALEIHDYENQLDRMQCDTNKLKAEMVTHREDTKIAIRARARFAHGEIRVLHSHLGSHNKFMTELDNRIRKLEKWRSRTDKAKAKATHSDSEVEIVDYQEDVGEIEYQCTVAGYRSDEMSDMRPEEEDYLTDPEMDKREAEIRAQMQERRETGRPKIKEEVLDEIIDGNGPSDDEKPEYVTAAERLMLDRHAALARSGRAISIDQTPPPPSPPPASPPPTAMDIDHLPLSMHDVGKAVEDNPQTPPMTTAELNPQTPPMTTAELNPQTPPMGTAELPLSPLTPQTPLPREAEIAVPMDIDQEPATTKSPAPVLDIIPPTPLNSQAEVQLPLASEPSTSVTTGPTAGSPLPTKAGPTKKAGKGQRKLRNNHLAPPQLPAPRRSPRLGPTEHEDKASEMML